MIARHFVHPDPGSSLRMLLVSLLVLLASSAARAERWNAGSPVRLQDGLEVVIDVRVERRGKPVRGLAADQFVLEVDGRAQPIAAVQEIDPDHALPIHYLVFIDDFFSVPSERNRILDGIREQLDTLGRQDRMAVLAFDGETVDVLHGWTRSLPALDEALIQARSRPSHGLLRLAEQRQFELSQRLSPRRFNSGGFAGVGLSGATQPDQGALSLKRAREITGQVAKSMRAATAALYALENDPSARNVMLMLSGGWQVAPDRWVVMPAQGDGPYTGIQAAATLFAPLIASTDQQGYTLYPVAVPSWTSGEPSGRRHPMVDDMLQRLAVETGGFALLRDDEVTQVLTRVARDFDGFYRLRFAGDWQHDRHRKRLRIEVADGRYRARTRKGLADPSRHEQIYCLAESARFLARQLPGAEELDVVIEAAAGGKSVPIRIRIAARAVALRNNGDAYVADLELRVSRFGDNGAGKSETLPMRFVRGDQPADGEVLVHETRVKLPKKAEQLLVSVYDPRDGTVLAREVVLPP